MSKWPRFNQHRRRLGGSRGCVCPQTSCSPINSVIKKTGATRLISQAHIFPKTAAAGFVFPRLFTLSSRTETCKSEQGGNLKCVPTSQAIITAAELMISPWMGTNSFWRMLLNLVRYQFLIQVEPPPLDTGKCCHHHMQAHGGATQPPWRGRGPKTRQLEFCISLWTSLGLGLFGPCNWRSPFFPTH